MLKVTVVSDASSWICEYVPELIEALKRRGCETSWCHRIQEIPDGDLVFYLGCGQLIPPEVLARNKHNLVIHESALPKGRGWSPLTWQILEGRREIPISLFEAENKVDSGCVYLQDLMVFEGHELVNELRAVQASTSIKMCLAFVDLYPAILKQGVTQHGEATYYPRRKPEDSRIDPEKSIKEQFNLLRVVDNDRYPAFFETNGKFYQIRIKKIEVAEKKR